MFAAALIPMLLAAPAPTRIAVVCASRSTACGPLESGVAEKLASPELTVIPAADLARAFGATEEDNAQLAAEKSLLDKAESAYYHASWTEARGALDEAAKLEEAEPLTAFNGPRLLALRAALDLKQGMKDKAASDAAAAVALDPDYDASAFPPAVQSLIEKAKGDLPTQAILKVTAVPADAEVSVDGRPVKGSIAVVPGAHTLIARAPGYATWVEKGLKVSGDASEHVRLAVAAPAALEKGARDWLAAGATEAAPRALEDASTKASADALAVLFPESGNKARAVLFVRGKATASPSWGDGRNPDLPKLVKWLKEGLVAAVPTPTPVAATPTPTPKTVAAVVPPLAGAAGGTTGAALVPPPQTNPAIAPPPVQSTSRPITKRPLFWAGVGGAVLAGVIVAAALGNQASSSGGPGPGPTPPPPVNSGHTVVTWP